MMNRLIILLIFLGIGLLAEKLTWGFSLQRHRLPLLSMPAYGTFPSDLHGKKWRLEAQGGQSYVFIAEDAPYVLKFFKDQPRPWLLLSSYQAKKQHKLTRTLTGYHLIEERCPHLSGIVCLHTQPSSPIPATLIDRTGNLLAIDLNEYLFVLQKKAELIQLPRSKIEKQALRCEASQLIHLLASHHLEDHDPRLHLNLGRIGSQLVLIDPGRVAECEEPSAQLPNKFLEVLRDCR